MGEDNSRTRIAELIHKLLGNPATDAYSASEILYSLMCALFTCNPEMRIVKYAHEWARGWVSERGGDRASVGVTVRTWEWLCERANAHASEWIVCLRDKTIFLMTRILIIFVLSAHLLCHHEDHTKALLIIVKVINDFQIDFFIIFVASCASLCSSGGSHLVIPFTFGRSTIF